MRMLRLAGGLAGSLAPGIADIAMCTLLGACYGQRTVEGTSAQYVDVMGKRIKVNVAAPDMPGDYRPLAVRDAIVIDSDPRAARRIMEITCQGRSCQVLDQRLADQINCHVRFPCSA